MLCCIVCEACDAVCWDTDRMTGWRDGARGKETRSGAKDEKFGRGVCGFAAGCSRVERWVSVTAAFCFNLSFVLSFRFF